MQASNDDASLAIFLYIYIYIITTFYQKKSKTNSSVQQLAVVVAVNLFKEVIQVVSSRSSKRQVMIRRRRRKQSLSLLPFNTFCLFFIIRSQFLLVLRSSQKSYYQFLSQSQRPALALQKHKLTSLSYSTNN